MDPIVDGSGVHDGFSSELYHSIQVIMLVRVVELRDHRVLMTEMAVDPAAQNRHRIESVSPATSAQRFHRNGTRSICCRANAASGGSIRSHQTTEIGSSNPPDLFVLTVVFIIVGLIAKQRVWLAIAFAIVLHQFQFFGKSLAEHHPSKMQLINTPQLP